MDVELKENYSLKTLNTFCVDVSARYFSKFHSVKNLKELINHANDIKMPVMVLGGGSNMLFTKNYPGLILKNEIKGIDIIEDTPDFVLIKAGSGEIWHDLVSKSVDMDFYGIENLSLIPGCCGAAPIQNIGAYGVEIKDVFYQLEALELGSGNIKIFDKEECNFGYRNSVFKNNLKGKVVITSITLKLQKSGSLNTSYGSISQELEKMNVNMNALTSKDVSNAVINIRTNKLPDPNELGNAGSFFKNPVVDETIFNKLISQWPDMVGYPAGSGKMKVAAGWLIEKCGWKGKRIGDVGSHSMQSLVIVNYGQATGDQIYKFAMDVKKSVKVKFDIDLLPEVNIL
jgi:UDP-N-acetylmuramate dehydrogenase